MKMPSGKQSYWEAKRSFGSHGGEVELFIDEPAPEAVPNVEQRAFFSMVEAQVASVMAAAEKVLKPQFEQWSRKPLVSSFEEEFTPTSFSIPAASSGEPVWEMSFTSKTDENHLFSVSFRGFSATGVSIDG
jgi:hypothetical protein